MSARATAKRGCCASVRPPRRTAGRRTWAAQIPGGVCAKRVSMRNGRPERAHGVVFFVNVRGLFCVCVCARACGSLNVPWYVHVCCDE
jgi:hypothetical protein